LIDKPFVFFFAQEPGIFSSLQLLLFGVSSWHYFMFFLGLIGRRYYDIVNTFQGWWWW